MQSFNNVFWSDKDVDTHAMQKNTTSPWKLAAQRVFIDTTSPDHSTYDESPEQLNQKYRKLSDVLKGIFFGHPPVKGPLKFLHAIGSLAYILSGLKPLEYLLYVGQLYLQKWGVPSDWNFLKHFKFVASIIASPFTTNMRFYNIGAQLNSKYVPYGRIIGLVVLIASMVILANILMISGVGPLLLAAIGANLAADLSVLVVGLLTFAGLNLVTRFLPGKISQKIENKQARSFEESIKLLVKIHKTESYNSQPEVDKNLDRLAGQIISTIRKLEKKYNIKFSSDDFGQFELLTHIKLLVHNNTSLNQNRSVSEQDISNIVLPLEQSLEDYIHLKLPVVSTDVSSRTYFYNRIQQIYAPLYVLGNEIESKFQLLSKLEEEEKVTVENIERLLQENPLLFSESNKAKLEKSIENIRKEEKVSYGTIAKGLIWSRQDAVDIPSEISNIKTVIREERNALQKSFQTSSEKVRETTAPFKQKLKESGLNTDFRKYAISAEIEEAQSALEKIKEMFGADSNNLKPEQVSKFLEEKNSVIFRTKFYKQLEILNDAYKHAAPKSEVQESIAVEIHKLMMDEIQLLEEEIRNSEQEHACLNFLETVVTTPKDQLVQGLYQSSDMQPIDNIVASDSKDQSLPKHQAPKPKTGSEGGFSAGFMPAPRAPRFSTQTHSAANQSTGVNPSLTKTG